MASASKACATLGVPFVSTNSELHARRRNTFFLHGPFKTGRRLIERAPTSRRLAPRSMYNQETRRQFPEKWLLAGTASLDFNVAAVAGVCLDNDLPILQVLKHMLASYLLQKTSSPLYSLV